MYPKVLKTQINLSENRYETIQLDRPFPFQQQEGHRLWAGARLLRQPGGQALHGPRGLTVRRWAGQEEEVGRERPCPSE